MSSIESWIIIDENGRPIVHQENDGAAFLANGPEATNTPTSFAELRDRSPTLYAEALAKMRTWCDRELARIEALRETRIDRKGSVMVPSKASEAIRADPIQDPIPPRRAG